MKKELEGKIALITGASRGIGAAVAKAYAAAGAHVILLARTAGALEEIDDVIRTAGGTATLMPLDLMRLNDVDKLGPSIAQRFGGLDILVGNAGMLGTLTPLPHMSARDWDQVMQLNVTANFRLIRTCDPLLRAAPAGRAIFTGSMTADRPRAYWGAYRISKAALRMMVQTYAAETENTNMRINIVEPGPVDTALLKEAYPGGYQDGGVMAPETLVPVYLDLASAACSRHGAVVKTA